MRIGLVKKAKIKCFSCVVVRFGEHVIDLVCSKQDGASLSAPVSEFCAMSFGGAHGIHSNNIVSDLQIDVSVRLETDSTSAYGICRRRGVGRLRHLHKKELWLQDQVAAKNVELGRVPSEDKDADLGTKYLEGDRITKCVTMMGMLIAGAWAEEQLLYTDTLHTSCFSCKVRTLNDVSHHIGSRTCLCASHHTHGHP